MSTIPDDVRRSPFHSPRRRAVARVCASERHTLYEIATALGVRAGSLTSVVGSMAKEGTLQTDDPSRSRGAQYWLRPDLVPELERAGQVGEVGALRPGDVALMVETPDLLDAAHVLQPSAMAGALAWAARVEGRSGDLLLVFNIEAGSLAVDRLRVALAARGAAAQSFSVREILSAEQLHLYGRSLRHSANRAV